MQALYAFDKQAGNASAENIEKELFFSVNKTYDLYHYLLILPIDLANYACKQIEIGQNKKLPTPEDLNPNTRFIDNRVIEQLRINNQLLRYVELKKLNWANYPELIKGIYHTMIESTDFAEYMSLAETTYESDKAFLLKLYKNIIATHEPLFQVLEEQSIYWNDEIEFVVGAIIKTLKKFKPEDTGLVELMPLYKSDDDIEFTKKLFRKVLVKKEEYNKLIQQFSKNWDFERIAFMDILLLEMAIAEATEFVSIPVKVTMNEYIEISKFYSTKRSNVFINGILDKILNHLKKTNQIIKQGRGLMGEE